MPEDPNLIWIDDVQATYERSRSWVEKQIAAGVLSVVKAPGDRRTYLYRSELDRLLRPRAVRRGELSEPSDDGEQSAG
jgi:hypothetical protein